MSIAVRSQQEILIELDYLSKKRPQALLAAHLTGGSIWTVVYLNSRGDRVCMTYDPSEEMAPAW